MGKDEYVAVIRLPRNRWALTLPQIITGAGRGDTLIVYSDRQRQMVELTAQNLRRSDLRVEVERRNGKK